MKKRIGVLIGEAEAPHCSSLLTGIVSEAARLKLDVFVFTKFNQTHGHEKHSKGEKSIYEIINYDKLDAILLFSETMRVTGLGKHLEETLYREFKGPVVCVDYSSNYFPSVQFDDIKLMKHMIHHLTDVHSYTSIAFLSGPLNHEHAVNRLTAYREALKERNIPIDETLIYKGNFFYGCTGFFVEELLKRDKLPQAIACANQHMAIDVYDELKKRGIRIPEDIAVTGYDAFDGQIKENYYITSTIRSGEKLGERVVQNLYERLFHINPTEKEESELTLIKWNTCGCEPEHKGFVMPLEYKDWEIVNRNSFENHFIKYNYMMEDLILAENQEECFEKCRVYVPYLGKYSDLYICLNEDWLTKQDKETAFSDNMILAIQDHKSKAGKLYSTEPELFSKKLMLPDIDDQQDKPKVYYFTALHFYGIVFGYSVISFEGIQTLFNRNYRHWIHNIEIGLQAQRQQYALHAIYKKVEEYAVRDLLTGVYSRNGFELYAPNLYEKAKEKDQNLIYIVGDINNLKVINDYYGHEWGDKALRILAAALENQIHMNKLNGMAFRTGGDEFTLLLVGNYSQKQVKEQIDEIDSYIEVEKEMYDTPINITASLGGCLAIASENRPLSEIMAEADQQMYKCKTIYRNTHKNLSLTRVWSKASFEAEVKKKLIDNVTEKYAFICLQIQDYELHLNVYGRQQDLIKHLGELIDHNLPKDCIAAKYSDRQYVVFLPYKVITDIENWLIKLNLDVKDYESQIKYNYSIKINSGIYLCNINQKDYSIKDMIERANLALQTAIDDTKRFIIYNEKMRDKIIEEEEVLQSIDRAIENNELHIYLQPQHYIQSKDKVFSAEVLVRWIKQDGTVICPEAFIQTLERSGLIAILDRIIMKLTCSFINKHMKEDWCKGLRFAVNVSKLNLKQEDFLEYYINIKNNYNIPDKTIEIELTESTVFEDYNIAKNAMLMLKENGFTCALDDFGSRRSALKLLKELPVDVIKIDGQFFDITEEKDHKRDNSVISSIVGMASGLGIKIVAEGVEDAEQVEFLREIGCDVVQGFIFSKPLSEERFIDYVKDYLYHS